MNNVAHGTFFFQLLVPTGQGCRALWLSREPDELGNSPTLSGTILLADEFRPDDAFAAMKAWCSTYAQGAALPWRAKAAVYTGPMPQALSCR